MNVSIQVNNTLSGKFRDHNNLILEIILPLANKSKCPSCVNNSYHISVPIGKQVKNI